MEKPAKEKEAKPAAAPVAEGKPDVKPEGYHPRLKAFYLQKVLPELARRHQLKNPHQVPRLKAIIINSGVSEAKDNVAALEEMKRDMALITGQQPLVRRARKSISNFKLRQGMPIGLKVTLRGDRMYEFFDRLVTVAVPRIRDFRGLDPDALDGHGNYNLGLREHHIFPEVSMAKSPKPRGMNVTFQTTAGQDHLARELLELMGMPFRKRKSA